jgi:hypothetical protein
MDELIAHIKNINAETQAWIAESPETRWAGIICEDPAHWAGYDIFTVEDFERHELEAAIWDIYKDVYGVRPRHINWKAMSNAELEDYYESLAGTLREEFEAQEKAKEAEEAEINAVCAEQGIDRATYDRWMREEDERQRNEEQAYLCEEEVYG